MSVHEKLQQVLNKQRTSFQQEGEVTLAVRRSRMSRMLLALLKNVDDIANALSEDYGYRPAIFTKSFEVRGLCAQVEHALEHLKEWMQDEKVKDGLVQQKT